jgi:Tol biopolymer transport system component
MCSKMMLAARTLVIVGLTTAAGAGVLLAQTTTRVSVDSQGAQGNGWSGPASSISADGRFIAFASYATNLVAGDTNGYMDVFVHDRQTGETTLVSVDSQGLQGNGTSGENIICISADGRFVVFDSLASNLVSGDLNGLEDVFVHDRETGETTLVSVDSQGTQGNGDSFGGSISADGRFVVFDSLASNLVPGGTNGGGDVFMHDRKTGETTIVSTDSQGAPGDST